MKPERLDQVDEIFQTALDLPPGERSAYLDQACAGDEALRTEIQSLVSAYEHSDGFIETPALEVDAAVIAGPAKSIVGQSIGHYQIIRRLGAGGMGEVYLASDTRTDRKVALKVLPNHLMNDEERVRRFQQEARAALALNHPNIVTIFEIGAVDGKYFIASEWIQGETLRTRIDSRSLSIGESLDIAIQVAAGLTEAHGHGIIHRDIKPENVMLRPDGYVKVLDFGIAKLTDLRRPATASEDLTALKIQTAPQMVLGTLNYMSPEQARALPVDERTDTWSLGVLLYEMIAGNTPFAGETSSEVMAAILEKRPAPLARYSRDAPEALEEIVTTALAKKREERYQTATQMMAALRRLKQRLDLAAELERTSPPLTGATGDLTHGQETANATTPQLTSVANVSSAEYLVNQVKRHKRGVALATVLTLIALAGLAFGLYKFFSRSQSGHPDALKVTPLTSSPYAERNVAFSPDGKEIAFIWTGEKGDNFDLYRKIIGTGEPLQLTNSPGLEMSPAWSPDGRYIAFLRGRGEGLGFYIISALGGGPERKLADAYEWTQGGPRPQALDWSPDGKTLALVDKSSEDEPWSISLLSVETGERRRLTQPPAGYAGDGFVSFSPDGSRLAFVRSRFAFRAEGDIYTIAVAGGEPARITSDEATVSGVAWTRDGAELIFSSDRAGGDPSLWRVPAAGGKPTLVAGIGQNVLELSIARQGERLAYAQRSQDLNIYRVELKKQPRGGPGAGAPLNFISSTRQDLIPQFSPDGRRIAFVSDRSGTMEVWVSDAEGRKLVQLTNFGGPHTDTPSWSPDSRTIVFTAFTGGNADIYAVNADGGAPRRLTSEPTAESGPNWSRDGSWIYFTSNRTGRSEVWKMPAAGGAAIQLTQGGGQRPVESMDGRTVYYAKGRSDLGLWQVPVSGGEETQFLKVNLGDRTNWAVAERGIYFLKFFIVSSPVRHPAYTLEFFDFATRQTTELATLEVPGSMFLISGLTISPDEHWVLYTQRDKLDFDLMLVENFR